MTNQRKSTEPVGSSSEGTSRITVETTKIRPKQKEAFARGFLLASSPAKQKSKSKHSNRAASTSSETSAPAIPKTKKVSIATVRSVPTPPVSEDIPVTTHKKETNHKTLRTSSSDIPKRRTLENRKGESQTMKKGFLLSNSSPSKKASTNRRRPEESSLRTTQQDADCGNDDGNVVSAKSPQSLRSRLKNTVGISRVTIEGETCKDLLCFEEDGDIRTLGTTSRDGNTKPMPPFLSLVVNHGERNESNIDDDVVKTQEALNQHSETSLASQSHSKPVSSTPFIHIVSSSDDQDEADIHYEHSEETARQLEEYKPLLSEVSPNTVENESGQHKHIDETDDMEPLLTPLLVTPKIQWKSNLPRQNLGRIETACDSDGEAQSERQDVNALRGIGEPSPLRIQGYTTANQVEAIRTSRNGPIHPGCASSITNKQNGKTNSICDQVSTIVDTKGQHRQALTTKMPLKIPDGSSDGNMGNHGEDQLSNQADLRVFQKQLEEALWRFSCLATPANASTVSGYSAAQKQDTLRGQDACRHFVQEILRDKSPRRLCWAWDWVLQLEQEGLQHRARNPAVDANARFIIALELLVRSPVESWNKIAFELEFPNVTLGTDDSNKQQRVRALRVIEFLSHILEASCEMGEDNVALATTGNDDVLREWVAIILPRLMVIASHGDVAQQHRRTVLSFTAWRTTLEWIAFACEYVETHSNIASNALYPSGDKASRGSPCSNNVLIVELWTNAAPCLHQLIELQQLWKQDRNGVHDASTNEKIKDGDIRKSNNQHFLAILKDWQFIYDECKRVYEYHFIKQQDDPVVEPGSISPNDHAARLAGSLWCQFVTGLTLNHSDDIELSSGVPSANCGVGGLRQTVLWSSPSRRVESARQWRVEDVLSWLALARESLSQSRNDLPSGRQRLLVSSAKTNDHEWIARPLLRGTLAWSFQRCLKHGRVSKKKMAISKGIVVTVEQQQELVELCLRVLSRCRSDALLALVLGVLNSVWSDSDGLPPDILQLATDPLSTDIPNSFEILLNVLHEEASLPSSGETDNIDTAEAGQDENYCMSPTCQALANMVSKCIVVSESRNQGLRLAQRLVSHHGPEKKTTVYVLLTILEDTTTVDQPQKHVDTTTQNLDEMKADKSRLINFAWSIISEQIPSSCFLRDQIRRSSSRMFLRLNMEFVIPKLVTLLADQLKKLRQRNGIDRVEVEDTIETAGLCLTRIMEQHAVPAHMDALDSMVRLILQTVETIETQQCEGTNDSERSSMQQTFFGRLCSAFLGRWRRSLLETSSAGNNDGFGNVLISLSNAFFDAPSSLATLTMFGVFVGESFESHSVNQRDAIRIMEAMCRLIELCVEKLRADSLAPKDVFSCLSPLLLLRRVPAAYFQIASSHSSRMHRGNYYTQLSYLTDFLAVRLDLGSHETETGFSRSSSFSAEERRLAAELVGRCLPFAATMGDGNDFSSCTVFSRICTPAFKGALTATETNASSSDERILAIKRARAALFATCHHIPSVSDDVLFDDDCYRLTASFAFSVLQIDVEAKGLDPELSDSVIKLQTGCIEFFAICIEKTLREQARDHSDGAKVVSELPPPRTPCAAQHGYSSKNSLGNICRVVIALLQAEIPLDNWVFSAEQHFLQRASTRDKKILTSARICLWNAFVLVSQRCNNDNGQLTRFAKVTVPWVMKWCFEGEVGVDPRHPLCLAAALQVLFLLITRTKSLSFSIGSTCAGERTETVRQIYRWTLGVVRRDTRYPGGEYANQALRLAGLKLLLAIFTVDQTNAADESEIEECLGPADVSETCTVLNSLANMNTDNEVQEVAAGLLRAFQVY